MLLIYASAQLSTTRSPRGADSDFGSGGKNIVGVGRDEQLAGLQELKDLQSASISKPITSVILLSTHDHTALLKPGFSQEYLAYFASGAADILPSPLSVARVSGLPAHILRTAPSVVGDDVPQVGGRKRRSSWVGGEDNKPYSYLRESMVSNLMDRICDPGYVEKPINTA